MKVLKKGEPKEWSVKVKCTGFGNKRYDCCGAELEVAKEDIYLTYSEHYWGETDIHYTITCPECGKETDIPDSKIPYCFKGTFPSKTDWLKARKGG